MIYNINGDTLSSAYDINGSEIDNAYTIDGEQVYSRYEPKLTLLNSSLMSALSSNTTPQGFAIYGDYYFQFFTGDNKMRVFNRSTYALVGEYSATDISHANTMQFGTVVQDTGFPLLYVSEWGESGEVDSKTIDVLKVSTSSYTKLSSFTLPSSVGNHPSFIVDWGNDIAYTVGYSGGTRDSEYMIISSFDIEDLTTPIEQYQVPYMGVLNGWEYYDGKLIYYGNSWESVTLIVSFIDVLTHDVTQYTFTKTTNEEYEDCCIEDDVLILSNWINDGSLKYRIYSMNLS